MHSQSTTSFLEISFSFKGLNLTKTKIFSSRPNIAPGVLLNVSNFSASIAPIQQLLPIFLVEQNPHCNINYEKGSKFSFNLFKEYMGRTTTTHRVLFFQPKSAEVS